jgi:large subunit ribosomal protein L24
MAHRVRKGDLVAVISGDDRGKRGRVLRVDLEKDRVIVEGVNLVYKHMRRSQKNPQGGRVRREAAIHVSNVLPVDPTTNRPTRVRIREEAGRRVRVGAKSGAVLEGAVTRRTASKAADASGAASDAPQGEER